MTIIAAVDGSALGNPVLPVGPDFRYACRRWFNRATNNGGVDRLAKLLEDTAEAGFADEPLVVLADSVRHQLRHEVDAG